MSEQKKKPKRGRPPSWKLGPIKEPDYATSYPEKIVQYMEQGLHDYEIMALLGCSRETFYRWVRENDQLKQAHEVGKPKRFKFWMDEARKKIDEDSDKGYKYWISVMNNCFSDMGWVSDYNRHGQGTQINIQNMQVIQNKDETELLESIKANFTTLHDHTKATLLENIPELKLITDDEFKQFKPD